MQNIAECSLILVYIHFRRKWAPGEPNNRQGKENCIELKFDGKLNDKTCTELRPFICEKYKCELHLCMFQVLYMMTERFVHV